MIVYSLVGKSGTGKSSNVYKIAYDYNIRAIIDDGLLIVDGNKVAGKSAKYEKTTMGAVKRAIFSSERHVKAVQGKLKKLEIDSLLIVGTSVKMVEIIQKQLELNKISQHYQIENVIPSEDIILAQNVRKNTGNHVIPIPHTQIEQNIFIKIIRQGIHVFSSNKEKIGETTVVQPFFFTKAYEFKNQKIKDIKEVISLHVVKYKMKLINALQIVKEKILYLLKKIGSSFVYWVSYFKVRPVFKIAN